MCIRDRLYATHCVACHNEQMHWRDKKQAVDWASLKAQVQLWQATGMLSWSEDDVMQVTRHLNDTYYRFVAPLAPGAGSTAGRWPGAAIFAVRPAAPGPRQTLASLIGTPEP